MGGGGSARRCTSASRSAASIQACSWASTRAIRFRLTRRGAMTSRPPRVVTLSDSVRAQGLTRSRYATGEHRSAGMLGRARAAGYHGPACGSLPPHGGPSWPLLVPLRHPGSAFPESAPSRYCRKSATGASLSTPFAALSEHPRGLPRKETPDPEPIAAPLQRALSPNPQVHHGSMPSMPSLRTGGRQASNPP